MSAARRFLATIRHVPPDQLARRFQLLAKRRARQALARHFPALRAISGKRGPALKDVLPLPVLPARAHLFESSPGGPHAHFLGRRVPIQVPLNWHPDGWDRGTRLEKLHLHYMEWLEGAGDELFEAVVRDWVAANPPYGPGYWLDAWNSYALSIRCVVWLQQYALRRSRLAPEFSGFLAESVVAQVRFLEANLETDIRGNHLVKNWKALLWAAQSFDGAEAARWRATGCALLAEDLDVQVLDDGLHFERSPAYHAQVFADLLECLHVLPAGPLRARLAARLVLMAQALADTTHPDGHPSLFNDGGLNMTYAAADLLSAHTALGGTGVVPRSVFALPSAGYFGARNGRNLVLVDCGAIGPDILPAHAHGDVLAFEWTVDGVRLVVDAGVFEYHPGAMRDWSRSTRAHNTVTVDDRDQAEFWSSFRVGRRPRVKLEAWEPATNGFTLVGSHDGFAGLAGRPIHRRSFRANARELEIRDELESGAGQQVRSRIMFHPEAEIRAVSGGLEIRLGNTRARLETESPIEINAGWWCPDFGESLRVPQIVVAYGAAPCRGRLRLVLVAPD